MTRGVECTDKPECLSRDLLGMSHMSTNLQAADRRALASALSLRGRVLKNRLVVAPMCTNYAAPDGSATREIVEYYRARGKGGSALVITEISFVDGLGSRGFVAQLGAHHDGMIPGLAEIAEAIQEGGALAGLQIGHCGGQRGLAEPPLVSASAVPWAPGKPIPKALTEAEVGDVVRAFALAARRAIAAGFDLVEVHGAHGYLVNAFLSPALNCRDDRYGGTPAARQRFAIDLATALRQEIGPERLLSFRINGDDLLPDGLAVTDYIGIAHALVDAGVDLLHVSAGTYRAMVRRISPVYAAEAPFVDLAAAIKQSVPAPVIASDTIHDPALAEDIVRRGLADLVSMARPNFADADVARKILAGRDVAVLPCIRCNACVAREQGSKRAYCAVNPSTGREAEPLIPAQRPLRVLVVGAGPAGIACALAAAQRGHTVTLAEREQRVGGQMALSADLPFKAAQRRLCRYYDHALQAVSVKVRRGWEVGLPSAIRDDYDVVVLATGPRWRNGWTLSTDAPPVVDPWQALSSASVSTGKIVVVGATMIGAEIAWHFSLLGSVVTLIDRAPDFASDVNLIYRLELRDRLTAAGIEMLFCNEAFAPVPGGVPVRCETGDSLLAADLVVAAFGARAQEIDAMPSGVVSIGECAGQFGLMAATRGGHRVGRRL